MLVHHLSLAGIAMVLELRNDNQRLRQELQDPAPAADLEQEER